MSHTIILQLLSVSELWLFDCFLMPFLYNLYSCNAISHTEFSQDDVLGTNECSSFLNLKVMRPLS